MKWTIKKKLMSGFFAVAVITLIVGITGLTSISKLKESNDGIIEQETIAKNIVDKEIAHLKWRTTLGKFQRDKAMVHVEVEKDPHKCGFGKWYYSDERKHAEELIPEIKKALQDIEEPHKALHETAIRIEDFLQKGDRENAAHILDAESSKHLEQVQKYLNEIRTVVNHDNEISLKNSIILKNRTDIVMIVMVVLGFVAAIFLGLYLTKSISKPAREISDAALTISNGEVDCVVNYQSTDEMGQIAEAFRKLIFYFQNISAILENIRQSDLTQDIEPKSQKDILGNSTKELLSNLRSTVVGIQDAASQIASGSQQVSSASQSLSQGATESASSLEEISSSMTEIGSQTKLNAENATQANQLAQAAKSAAEHGGEQINTTVDAMNDINNSSKQIAKIIKVIDDIAFQTNLLALNAAVEAARAGKHGKGFAVVADEVRNLASRSAKAAKETAELIESSNRKVEHGLNLANETAKSFTEIVSGTVKVADLVGEIASASQQQAQGIAQISTGLEQIDQVTQTNTASAEETAASAEELSGQAEELHQLIAQFRLPGGTSKMTTHTSEKINHASRPVKLLGAAKEKVVKPSDVIALDDKDFGKY